jgi:diacylglycerol kinase (ATP)
MELSARLTVALIVNPIAGSGRARAMGTSLRERIPGSQLHFTTAPGDATRLTQAAIRAGSSTIVSVGGDGTISECCGGLVSETRRTERPALAVVPAGTGSDYGRSFGLADGLDRALVRITNGRRVAVDLGAYRFPDEAGSVVRYFNNVMSFGIGGLTDRIVSQGPKWLGGRVAFFLGGVRATLAYSPTPIRLTFDDGQTEFGAFQNVAVCVGQYFGGGMRIAPEADPSDGYFDVIMMRGTKAQTLTLAKDIYAGKHLGRAHVTLKRTRTLLAEVTRPGEVLIDADGEQVRALPVSLSIEPRALDLLVD